MTMRRQAQGSFKPLASLPFLTLILTALLALPSIMARSESPAPAKFVTPGEMNRGTLLLQTQGGLEAKQVSDGDQGIAKSIEKVALLHHRASSQTSLVAIGPATSRPDGENVTSTELPLNLPDGWVYDKVFGRPIAGKQLRAALPLKQALAFDQAAAPFAASNLADVAATPAEEALAPQPVAASYDTADAATETEMPQSPATGVTAPQETSIDEISATPTLNSQTRQIGMFILLLTILSAVTLLLWRHYRRDDASPRRIGRRI
jgi:hypothetical protein